MLSELDEALAEARAELQKVRAQIERETGPRVHTLTAELKQTAADQTTEEARIARLEARLERLVAAQTELKMRLAATRGRPAQAR